MMRPFHYKHPHGYLLPRKREWDDLQFAIHKRKNLQLNRTVERLAKEGLYPLNSGIREVYAPLKVRRYRVFSRHQKGTVTFLPKSAPAIEG